MRFARGGEWSTTRRQAQGIRMVKMTYGIVRLVSLLTRLNSSVARQQQVALIRYCTRWGSSLRSNLRSLLDSAGQLEEQHRLQDQRLEKLRVLKRAVDPNANALSVCCCSTERGPKRYDETWKWGRGEG